MSSFMLFSICATYCTLSGFAQARRISQDPKQITVRIKAVLLRRFNQTVDHGAGLCATGCIGKQPVLPAHHKGLNAALGTIVAQLQTAILQIPCQVRPLLEGTSGDMHTPLCKITSTGEIEQRFRVN